MLKKMQAAMAYENATTDIKSYLKSRVAYLINDLCITMCALTAWLFVSYVLAQYKAFMMTGI